VFDHSKRISARDAMSHQYFAGVSDIKPTSAPVPKKKNK